MLFLHSMLVKYARYLADKGYLFCSGLQGKLASKYVPGPSRGLMEGQGRAFSSKEPLMHSQQIRVRTPKKRSQF